MISIPATCGALRIALLIGLILPGFHKGYSQAGDVEDHVTISIAVLEDTVGPGAENELRISFKPAKGYHVNAVPAMSVRIDSSVPARAADSVMIPTDSATGYLSTKEPVRVPFLLAPGTARGGTTISGTLTFFYCSDKEGWCRREKWPFTIPLTVQ